MKRLYVLLFIGTLCISINAQREQRRKDDVKDAPKETEQKSVFSESTFGALKLRNIGPAFTSGRIADIAIHPDDENTWYVAVGSGGVWKTQNAGVTWTPIFDDQGSYSIGCVTIDPNNPNIVWVGTGENVGGRHVGFGDGIYRSKDGGKSWKNMGLKNSEHISKVIIHPYNSDMVWVASQGPLWSEGGDRGFFKSVDGGVTWKKTLGDNMWTGVTDIALDPNDPNRLYAATWQHHRTIAAHMGGGPESGLHRSLDGGETWEKLTTGLPNGNMGKIGIAISSRNPDVLYAAIELDRTTGAVYKSSDRGASWSKQSDAVSGGTGPHYYQELYACPHVFDRLYLCDVRIQVSDDGGKTFRQLEERNKHSDNHAIAFREDDPDYLLVGCDGGIYESYDLASNWRFIDNLPVTQYYKVAVDDRLPFYHIYGGTQDNGSHGGPSRTDKSGGIKNADWYVTLGADGHQSATEPGNPDIMYAETQEGGLHRVDRITMEQVYIQPQPRAGEDAERYNWDAPILVSPHKPSRIYFASQRVWKSENRGDSWTPISGDLTRNQQRLTLPIMGKTQSWDSPWDLKAMSNYNTISSLAESPLQEGLIYAGTDDGLVQVTEDGGATWRKIEITSMPGVPATAFVNNIKTDLHDANTLYVALDNHKYGDFNPYLVKSTDRGRTWASIKGNIPERTLVWRIVQDHIKPNLLFIATEFGVYFTLDGGLQWTKLKGAPTISFRDLTIQRRENDLVCASFGRGFFVLDDYSPLREITEEVVQKEGHLFSTRAALWYAQPFGGGGSRGANEYSAPNPPFGAVFTYHLGDDVKTLKSQRQEKEKELTKENKDISFPGWEALEAERRQQKPLVWLSVKDVDGNVIRRIEGPTSKGLQRVAWDLRYQSKGPIDPDVRPVSESPFESFRRASGMAVPGSYSVSLFREVDGQLTTLAGPMNFEIAPLRTGALQGKSFAEIDAYRKALDELSASVSATNIILRENIERVRAMRTALSRTDIDSPDLVQQLHTLNNTLLDLDTKINGNKSKAEIGELDRPTIDSRLGTARRGLSTTYGPTAMHAENLEIVKLDLKEIETSLDNITNMEIPKVERALQAAGAPWIVGQALPRS
ncbi:MAG TPA: hypothetical protein VI603_03955 [Saprospiraceae bacterium]|nr:hypothetical protein [Saprospiraceae bacterium]